jgi:hypothetical protein
MENNGEAIFHDMIKDDTDKEDGDYTQYEETQYDEAHEGYSDNQPLFGNDGFTQAMGEGITQATAATLAASLAEVKKVSQRRERRVHWEV